MATRGERFRKAFAEARRRGDKKFYFEGGWYETKLATETKAKSSTYKVGDHKTRFKQGKDGTINATVTGTQKGEDPVTVTAGYTKIIRNNKNFLNFVPIDERTDLVDNNGNTRVYYNRNNGMYYVTDNYGYIIGTSNDERAKNNGFMEFVQYGDNKESLKRSGASRINMRANMNEANQLSRQKEERAGRELQDNMNRGRAYFANTVSGVMNTPNHAIMGAARVLNPLSPYSFTDYLKGFNPGEYYEGNSTQTAGLGDVFEVQSEPARMALNLVGNAYTAKGLTGKYSPRLTEGTTTAYNYTRFRTPQTGRFVKAKATYRVPNGQNKHLSDSYPMVYKDGKLVSRKTVIPEEVYKDVIAPKTVYVKDGRVFVPHHPINENVNVEQVGQENVPTYSIEYTEAGSNPTIEGRLLTGDFVPGTTAPEWGSGNPENGVMVISSYGSNMNDLGGRQMSGRKYTSRQSTEQKGSHSRVSRKRFGGKLLIRK